MVRSAGYLSFNSREAATATALFERLFPADDPEPGATEIGVVTYLDRALAGAYADLRETYRLGLQALETAAGAQWQASFAAGTTGEQDRLLSDLEQGCVEGWETPEQQSFFAILRAHLQEGLFADPLHGGNRDKRGWQLLGHPGVWLDNTAAENLSPDPVTKGGVIQSLADVGYALGTPDHAAAVPGYDPQAGAKPAAAEADVVLVGVGAVGGIIAPILAKAGLRVVGLEAGPYWLPTDFAPDELGSTYYCRGEMGQKFLAEVPRWRRAAGEPTQPLTFSLGRMMNGVGGSVIHYGGWLRRFHPHHFRFRSHVLERWGAKALPEGSTLVDWPQSYADLEAAYCRAEAIAGVTGDGGLNPFIPRSRDAPLPPLRPFRLGEAFQTATTAMGLHPHPAPVGMTSQPYGGWPEMRYTAWNNGFGSWTGDKWHPGLTTVPEALATGNFDLRTHCRVVRIVTDRDGRARGVEYVDASGRRQVQTAAVVILCAYTFENVRLMLLSADGRHPAGLGNKHDQLGRHYMAKMFGHVDGLVPDTIFNRHTGPAAQAMVLDDFVAESFDGPAHGFLGGATLGAENQFLPLQISRESLPPEVPGWGLGYKQHLQRWQHLAVVRIQADALPYAVHTLDLDPDHRDRSGLGLPVVRVTYDLQPNERRLADYMEGVSEEVLRRMGATSTWRGPSFTGAGSSHDLGGCRMGTDPASSVVDPTLRVHDTPGLYMFGGAAFPTCPGINPTLTLWALALQAADRLVERFQTGSAA